MASVASNRLEQPLPSKLAKEPLLEAVCQLNVGSSVELQNLLPGVMFSQFPSEVSAIEPLPAMQLPAELRGLDQAIAEAWLLRFQWRGFSVLVSPHQVAVTTPIPYPGWNSYKSAIATLFKTVLTLPVVNSVERLSVKYTNLIEGGAPEDRVSQLDFDLRIGGLNLSRKSIFVRAESELDGCANILEIAGDVTVQVARPQMTKNGLLVAVDTIQKDASNFPCSLFVEDLDRKLDAIRLTNKKVFFSSLTAESIKSMGPTYE